MIGQDEQGARFAVEVRETCIRCGMVANVDPWLHEERYGHEPEVSRDGQTLRHGGNGAFYRMLPTDYLGHCREVGCHYVAQFHDQDDAYRCAVHSTQTDSSWSVQR